MKLVQIIGALCTILGASLLADGSLFDFFQWNNNQKDTIIKGTGTNCTTGDIFCNVGCSEVVLCLADDELLVLENCSLTPQTPICDSNSLACKAPSVAKCNAAPDEFEFDCHASGTFPDPYNCHNYYTCLDSTGQGILGTCPEGDPLEYGYDSLTTMCRYTRSDRVCRDGPIPPCRVLGQSGAQRENPNIYYICVNERNSSSLKPLLFKCRHGYEIYDEGSKECISGAVSTTPSWNTTDWNTTDWNTTDWNTTHWNTTDWNTTDWTTTDWYTTDDWNTTDWNTTDWNTTDWNTTDWNTTDWNTTDWYTSTEDWNSKPWYGKLKNKLQEIGKRILH